MRVWWAATLPLLLLACDSQRNPLEPGERGQVVVWRITSASAQFDTCTSAPFFRDVFDGQQQQLVGAGIAYRVADDYASATLVDCTEAGGCVPWEPPVVLGVEGNVLSAPGEPRRSTSVGLECVQEVTTAWRLEDRGAELEGSLTTRYALVGEPEDCSSLNQLYVELGGTDIGIDGCSVTLELKAEFHGNLD